ncbi:MAG: GGDEF domain-containing protein [Deltaproteobacteria bacterium]|nr:GGDEF domain-containing protein [Deltaproteobacteria bacterium]
MKERNPRTGEQLVPDLEQLDYPGDDSTVITSAAKLGLDAKQPLRKDRACLIVITGGAVGELHPLDRPVTVMGRGREADVRIDDGGISRRHARVVRLEEGGFVLEDLGSTNGTFVGEKPVERHDLVDGDRIGLGRTTVLKFTMQDELEETFQRQMYESAVRDPLTRAFNRKYFMDRLRTELSFANRHRTSVSLLLLDIDHFKRINDTRGHLAGDCVLRSLCGQLHKLVRAEDVVARYGGEEFAVLVRGIDPRSTEILAERIRRSMESLGVPWPGGDMRITVSIGIGFTPDGVALDTPEKIIAKADENLYAAKNAGRNRVVM